MTKKLELIVTACILALGFSSSDVLADKPLCNNQDFVYEVDKKCRKKKLEEGDSFLVTEKGSLFYCPLKTAKCYPVKCGPTFLNYFRTLGPSVYTYEPDMVPYYIKYVRPKRS